MSGQTTHYQHHHRAQSPPIINRTRHLQDDESFFFSSLHILMRFRYHRILGACCCNKYVVVVAIHDSGTNVIRNRLCSKCHRRSINASLSSLRLRFSLSRRNGFGDFLPFDFVVSRPILFVGLAKRLSALRAWECRKVVEKDVRCRKAKEKRKKKLDTYES